MPLRPLVTIRSTTVDGVAFFCPTCGGDRAAEVREGRRWLSLGRVPLLPLRKEGRHLTCVACWTDHPMEATQRLTSAALAEELARATRALTALVVRTGDPTDRALRSRAVLHVRASTPTYDQNQLDRDMAALDPAQAHVHVQVLAVELAPEGKEHLIRGLVHVAMSANTVTPNQRQLLAATGTELGLTPTHLTGVISQVVAAVEPADDDPVDRS
ncbi:MAG: hypothetical protein U0P45_15320 [Acidimicrobiales bacterium]